MLFKPTLAFVDRCSCSDERVAYVTPTPIVASMNDFLTFEVIADGNVTSGPANIVSTVATLVASRV